MHFIEIRPDCWVCVEHICALVVADDQLGYTKTKTWIHTTSRTAFPSDQTVAELLEKIEEALRL